MQESKQIHMFDTKTIISDVEKVIQDGLNKLLVNYIDRHELLEKTHQQLIQLPSIVEELNRRKRKVYVNDSDSESETEKVDYRHVNIKKDARDMLYIEENPNLKYRLDKVEKRLDSIIPILDKLLNKITHLNEDIKEIKSDKNEQIETTHTIQNNNADKSSVVNTSENENIKIHFEDPTETEELEEDENSDDEDDFNPAMITCSRITLKVEDKFSEEDEELSVEEELGIEEIKIQDPLEEVQEESTEDVEEESTEEVEEESTEDVEEESTEEVEEESTEEVEEESTEEESTREEVKGPIEEIEEESGEEEVEESVEEDHEEASIETETKDEEDEDEESSIETETKDEEEDIFEIDIDDKTYCTNNDENGFIWELTEDGEQGEKVGYFKEGEPFFYAEEN